MLADVHLGNFEVNQSVLESLMKPWKKFTKMKDGNLPFFSSKS